LDVAMPVGIGTENGQAATKAITDPLQRGGIAATAEVVVEGPCSIEIMAAVGVGIEIYPSARISFAHSTLSDLALQLEKSGKPTPTRRVASAVVSRACACRSVGAWRRTGRGRPVTVRLRFFSLTGEVSVRMGSQRKNSRYMKCSESFAQLKSQ
jgi:hypothetical protein